MELYIVLGCQGVGRREVVLDLVRFGPEIEGGTVVLLSEDEQAHEIDAKLNDLPMAQVQSWRWDEGYIDHEPWPENTARVFFVVDGMRNPVDQLEALHAWLIEQQLQLSLVYTIAHTQLMHSSSKARRWHEACIHFSDIVFLNRREDVPNKWLDDCLKEFRNKHCYPCLFELVKKGKVKNHAQMLFPEPRRMATLFEDIEPAQEGDCIIVTEGNYEGDDDPHYIEEDAYLIRNPDGRRDKVIPEISEFIESE